MRELELVEEAILDIAPGIMSIDQYKIFFNRVNISRWNDDQKSAFAPPGFYSYLLGDIVLTNTVFGDDVDWTKYVVVHEFGHVWDYRSGNELSIGLMMALGTWVWSGDMVSIWDPFLSSEPYPGTLLSCIDEFTGLPNYSKPGCQPYSMTYGDAPLFTGPGAEDWATSFATFTYPLIWLKNPDYLRIGLIPGGIRETYVQDQIQSHR